MAVTQLAKELGTQPDDWQHAQSRAADLGGVLPDAGMRVAAIGCGTSWFMAQSYAARRDAAGQGETDAFAASEHLCDRRDYDKVVVISRSGTTTEVVRAIDDLRHAGIPSVAIVATAGTPIVQAADQVVLMPEVDEQSVVQTRFATTTLALLRASLGEDLSPAIADARAVLAADRDPAIETALGVEQITFLGRGFSTGIAHEAALKLRESAQFWTESYPAMEYRHGPISIAGPGRAVWMFGELPPGLDADIARTGATLIHHDIDPLAELVRVHRLCDQKAARAGIDPDAPRHLTRSIVLEGQ